MDVHAHIEMLENPQVVLNEAYHKGVEEIIAVSVNVFSYEKVRKIRSKGVNIHPSLGIHPWEALAHSHELDGAMEAVKKIRFVGEIGLDNYFTEGAREHEIQLKIFEAFLQACDGTDKVLNIHSVAAEEQVLKLLQKYKLKRVNMHWYDAIERMKPLKLVSEFVKLGCFMSIPPAVMTSKSLRELVKLVPMENLLTETDTHPIVKYGNLQSAPRLVPTVIGEIARIREMRRDEVEIAVSKNFDNLVG